MSEFETDVMYEESLDENHTEQAVVEELTEESVNEDYVEIEKTNELVSIDTDLVALAYEVKSGQYGTGELLRSSLTNLGVDYDAVMAIVATL